MKVNLKKGNSLKHFVASNDKGHTIELGNDGETVGPMQSVLMAAAGCSTIDVVMILEKMRQEIKDIEVEVEGERREEVPRTFTKIHLHYKVYGDVDEKKVARAVKLSLGEYCSVSKMLEKAVEITSSYEVLS